MSNIITDLSSSPYWDDYNVNKQYYRILFVPKRAVQVREMNQMQAMIQEQIRRFGNHIFKDGSIVSGCNIIHNSKQHFVRLGTLINSGNTDITTSAVRDFLVVSEETGLRASIQIATPGYIGTYPDTNMFFISYLNKGEDVGGNEVDEFQPGEILTIYDKTQDKFGALNPGLVYNQIPVITPEAGQEATGLAYSVTVGEGVVYQKGYFVNVLQHQILVSKHNTEVAGKLLGFETTESIVSYLQDPSLIDPADTSNRNGIGANRLKLVPQLVVKTREEITADDEFFPIVEFGEEDKPIKQNTDPEYAKLGDYLAKEKYETNGDFYIKPFIVGTEEAANTSNFRYTVDSGIAYVKGNRVQLLNTIYLEQPRATELGFYNGNITTLNYGNYIVVKELVGTFNSDKQVAVDIYDTPQTAVTSTRSPSTPTGSKIGTANVRTVLFETGVKGTPTATYRFYVSNIIMNPGKSFATDAKSFVVSAATNGLAVGALADIVLTDGKAILKDSSLAGLVFDTGVKGTRRHRDSIGTNDTSFTFRDIATATLQANGSVTFTLNTPYAGGSERFFVSSGALSSANKEKVTLTTTAPLVTANLAGTVNGNTGNTLVVGTGTTFTTSFKPGEYIRVANTTNYRIVSIANNTHMTVHTNVTGGAASANYQKFYMTGAAIDLADATVTALSNTQFTVSLPTSISSGAPQTVIASYPVVRSSAHEAKKEVKRGTLVKIDCTANTTGPFNLGLVDVFSIDAVYVGNSYSANNPDRKSWFTLDSGQRLTHYDHAKLILRPEFQGKLSSSSRLLVKLNHFVANTTAGVGFFTADSYPVRAPGDTANTTNISYDEIPEVDGYNLRNCVDFRPQKFNTSNVTTNANTATVNPAAANSSFNISVSGSFLGEPDSNFQSDIEYYLPRIDIIQVNREGTFSVKSSTPQEKPTTPLADPDSTVIATAYVAPYPGITMDESSQYPASKPRIKTNMTGIRGYTMRDINLLDKRITTLEYQTALSMLEQQAKDYKVRDENGLERFKNGIFADPLKNHLLGDVSNFEYAIAIDEMQEIARPRIKRYNVDMDVSNTVNTVSHGRVTSLSYDRQLYTTQPYATKFRNVTQSVWNWRGIVNLYPEYDYANDEKQLPAVNVTIDTATPWEQFENSPFGSSFGDWRVTNTNTTVSTSFEGGQVRRGVTTGATAEITTTTTTNTLQRTVTDISVSSTSTKNDLGSYITDVTLNPYMRSRQIAFIATGLRPNTRMYAFFANEPVSEFCAPGVLNTSVINLATGVVNVSAGKEDAVVTRSGNFGAPLKTDANGNLYGIFNLPSGRFRVGDRQFRLVDVDDLDVGSDAILSSADAIYSSSSLTTSARNISITTITPKISFTGRTETSVQSTTNVTRREIPRVNTVNNELSRRGGGGSDGGADPLGQTILAAPPGDLPGMFLEAIEVFFRSKDPNMGVTCYITETIAGTPDTKRVLASAYLKSSEVNVSSDSSVGTVFKFNEIPYLVRGNYYAFFIKPDGDSPEYTVWMSEIGGTDILTGTKIFSNPYIGNAVLSANSDSWDNLITEDIKFNAYICNFTSSSGIIDLHEQDDEYLTVDGMSYSNNSTVVQVGDVVYTVDSNNNIVVGNNAPFALVQSFDHATDELVLDSSTGGFAANDTIHIYRPAEPGNPASVSANNLIATTKIVSVDDIEYSIIVPRIALTTPTGTAVNISYRGIDIASIEDTEWHPCMPETELEMIDKVRVIKSKSNRSPGERSSGIRLQLTTTSNYLSPIIDLRRRSMMVIDNIINNSVVGEETRYGEALAKYVSRPITLAEGQDAEDVKLFVTAYRPVDTEIHAYMKILNGEDHDALNDKLWTKLEMVEGASVRSSSADTSDFREFGFSFPTTEQMQGTAWKNAGNDGIVQYRNAAGQVFVGYKSFAVKLVLTSSQKQRVPRIDDYFGICLQI